MAKGRGKSAFSQHFAELLERAEATQSDFSRKVGHPRAFINQLIHGTRTPPLDEMDKWARVLQLTGRERQRFLDLAALAHLPSDVEQRFLTLFVEHDGLIEQYRQLGVTLRIPKSAKGDRLMTSRNQHAHRRGEPQAEPTPSEQELVAARLHEIADELAADAIHTASISVESQLSAKRRKPTVDTETEGRSA